MRPSVFKAVRRGLRRRCPRCGRGRLFKGWYAMRHDCSACGLIFEPNPGDTWGFWVIGDRVFLLAAMVALFVGFRPETWSARVLFLLLVAVPLVWTMPNRQGVAIAMDYLGRTYTGYTDEGSMDE